jgi:uncharacterized delta-60 repeat protein
MNFLKYLLLCFSVVSAVSCSNALNDANRSASDPYPAPSAPDLSVSDSQITATWNSIPNVISYKIYYYTSDSISNALEFAGNSTITGNSCTISGLTNNVTYYIWVKAQYAKGSVFSPPSAATPVIPLTAPSAPVISLVSPGDTQVKIQWTAVSGASLYEVYSNILDDSASAIKYNGDTNTADTACTITGLTNGTTCYFWVKAVNSIGSSPLSASASGTPAAPETAPSAPVIQLVTAGDTQLMVQWAAVTGAAAYEIYSNTLNDSASASKFTGDANTADTACTITGLANGTAYYIWVKAVNAIGSSPFSASASGIPAAPNVAPDAPGIPLITAGDSQLVIQWSTVSTAASYEVYSSTSNASSTAVKFTGDTNTADTACSMTGLTNGTTYYIWIKAVNAIGKSEFSASASGTPAVPETAPSAPGIPSVTAGYSKLIIKWSAAAKASSYDVYSSTTNDSTTATKFDGDTDTADTSCTLTGLTNGTAYYIWIKAVNAIGSSPFSIAASGTPSAALAPGELDTTFISGAKAGYTIYSSAVQSEGKILIGGSFSTYNGTACKGIARLNTDGSIDASFDSSNGAVCNSSNATIYAIAVQTDGKIIIGGYFTKYGGVTQNGVTRLNSDGSYDTSFNSSKFGTTGGGIVRAISVLPDSKILIGGIGFTEYNGAAANRFARLNSDGTLDSSFDTSSGSNSSVRAITVQSDGKIYIGGDFTSYNGTTIYRLARINTDGTLDTTFNPGTAINNGVYSLGITSGGNIIIGGDFTKYNTTAVVRIAQLNSTGSLDTSFNTNIGTGADGAINAIAIQTDGKIIIGGAFTYFNSTTVKQNHLARLNADGSFDSTFSIGTGSSSAINTIAIQSDGNILIGGGFTSYNGTTQKYIARVFGN